MECWWFRYRYCLKKVFSPTSNPERELISNVVYDSCVLSIWLKVTRKFLFFYNWSLPINKTRLGVNTRCLKEHANLTRIILLAGVIGHITSGICTDHNPHSTLSMSASSPLLHFSRPRRSLVDCISNNFRIPRWLFSRNASLDPIVCVRITTHIETR